MSPPLAGKAIAATLLCNPSLVIICMIFFESIWLPFGLEGFGAFVKMQKGTHARAEAITIPACSPEGAFSIVRNEDSGVGSSIDRVWMHLRGQMLARRRHLNKRVGKISKIQYNLEVKS